MLAVLSFALPASAFPTPLPVPALADVDIPVLGAWTDQGIIISPGPPGSWEVRLDGAISPTTAVKFKGVYYLYYIGADGNRSDDQGPRPDTCIIRLV